MKALGSWGDHKQDPAYVQIRPFITLRKSHFNEVSSEALVCFHVMYKYSDTWHWNPQPNHFHVHVD